MIQCDLNLRNRSNAPVNWVDAGAIDILKQPMASVKVRQGLLDLVNDGNTLFDRVILPIGKNVTDGKGATPTDRHGNSRDRLFDFGVRVIELAGARRIGITVAAVHVDITIVFAAKICAGMGRLSI